MQYRIDTETQTLTVNQNGGEVVFPLYSPQAFESLSDIWVKVGWGMRYPYTFSWLGRPIIQLPEDMIRVQEVIWRLKPDFIVETGVAHGGSLIFYASLLHCIGKGRVIGIDIEIRAQNRAAIESHQLSSLIELIEGSSTAPEVVEEVTRRIPTDATVLVILDSNHTRAHVLAELDAYHRLVSLGSYIVATDGIMSSVHDVPGGQSGWVKDNPAQAAIEFQSAHPEFVIEQPEWPFNESSLAQNVTHWPAAWLRRRNTD